MKIFSNIKFAVVAAAMIASSAAQAAVITYSTAQSQFDRGVMNQGWWSATARASDDNDNHITGTLNGAVYRSFYTFDLSQLVGTVTSATLRVQRGTRNASGNVNVRLYDVSTAASVVNNNTGTNASIFNDLGTGKTYGAFPVGSGPSNAYLSFNLNEQALIDINAVTNFFTIGAAVNQNQYIFGGTGRDETFLDLNVVPSAVPEPATVALLGLGLIGFAASRRKLEKKKNA